MDFELAAGAAPADQVSAGIVSGNYFDVVGLGPVVGRRGPAGLMLSPARALSRLDFPTPVPPTRATT